MLQVPHAPQLPSVARLGIVVYRDIGSIFVRSFQLVTSVPHPFPDLVLQYRDALRVEWALPHLAKSELHEELLCAVRACIDKNFRATAD